MPFVVSVAFTFFMVMSFYASGDECHQKFMLSSKDKAFSDQGVLNIDNGHSSLKADNTSMVAQKPKAKPIGREGEEGEEGLKPTHKTTYSKDRIGHATGYVDTLWLETHNKLLQDLKQFTQKKDHYFKQESVKLVQVVLKMTPFAQNQIRRIFKVVSIIKNDIDILNIRDKLQPYISERDSQIWVETLINEPIYTKMLLSIIEAMPYQNPKDLQSKLASFVQKRLKTSSRDIIKYDQSIIEQFVDKTHIENNTQTKTDLINFTTMFNKLLDEHRTWSEEESHRKLLIQSHKLKSETGKKITEIIDQQTSRIKAAFIQSYDYITFHTHQTDYTGINKSQFRQVLQLALPSIKQEILLAWSMENNKEPIYPDTYLLKVQLQLKYAIRHSKDKIVHIIVTHLNNIEHQSFYFKNTPIIPQTVQKTIPAIQSVLASAWRQLIL